MKDFMVRWVASLLVISSPGCFVSDGAAAEQTAIKVRLVISTHAEPSSNQPLLSHTVKALQKEFGEENVSVRVCRLPELEKVVREGGADVFISSSGNYLRFADSGVRNIATMVSNKLSDPNKSEGSAIIVRGDRSDIKTLADLKGKSIGANMLYGFSGHLFAKYEIFKRGYNPEKFFSRTEFVGHDVEKIIEQVMSGKLDAGILRTCYWEEYADRKGLPVNLMRIVNEQETSGFACKTSTALYPNWTIASTPSASPELSRRLTRSVLSVEPTGKNSLYWGISTDFTQLNRLLKDMAIGPYAIDTRTVVRNFVKHFGEVLIVALALLLVFLIHYLRVGHLVRKRSEELLSANHKTLILENRYRKLQQIGVAGLMSSTIAHEIRQPLGTIQFFAEGFLNKLKSNGSVSTQETQNIIERILEQGQKMDQTISRIKKHAERGNSPVEIDVGRRLIDLAEQAANSRTSAKSVQCNVHGPDEPLIIRIDSTCFDLVFSNLLRNAYEFGETADDPRIDISLHLDKGAVCVEISNNGKAFDPKQLQTEKVFSTKMNGLGFGIPIAVYFTESMGGQISFSENEGGGLRSCVRLPAEER